MTIRFDKLIGWCSSVLCTRTTARAEVPPQHALMCAHLSPLHSGPCRHGKGYSGSGTPPGTHDSWELAACKTSDRFRSAQHHSGSADLQQWSMSGGSWYLKGAGFAVNSAAVPAPTAVSLIGGSAGDDNKITLGVLLGAGGCTALVSRAMCLRDNNGDNSWFTRVHGRVTVTEGSSVHSRNDMAVHSQVAWYRAAAVQAVVIRRTERPV